jgi:hypothetical protein
MESRPHSRLDMRGTPLPYEMRSLGYLPVRLDMRGTTQGGPRGEGRSCGTGGDPVLIEEKISLWSVDDGKKLGGDRWARSLDAAGELRPDATGDRPCGVALLLAPATAGINAGINFCEGGAGALQSLPVLPL